MVSVLRRKGFASDSEIHRSHVHPNFIAQRVIKPDMKIKLRMEGAVNGHKLTIEGEGKGKPLE